MARMCADGCGRAVEQDPTGGGRRKYSEVCRPPRQRVTAAGEGSGQVRQSAPAPAAVGPAVRPGTEPRVPGELETATRDQLAAAGRSGALVGHLLLQLARRMDEAESPSAYATLAGQFRATAVEALPEAPAPAGPADPADDIARRRAERARAAGASA